MAALICYNISEILKINVDNLDFVESKEDEKHIMKLIDDKLKELESKYDTKK